MVRALYIPEGGYPSIVETEGDLKSLQGLVGGCIEAFGPLFGDKPLLWVNDEGMFSCMPNRTVLASRAMEEAGYLSQIDGSEVKEGNVYAILFGPIVAMSYERDSDGEDVPRDITDEEVAAVIASLGGPDSGLREVRRIRSER